MCSRPRRSPAQLVDDGADGAVPDGPAGAGHAAASVPVSRLLQELHASGEIGELAVVLLQVRGQALVRLEVAFQLESQRGRQAGVRLPRRVVIRQRCRP
jgi:hypothetical protein